VLAGLVAAGALAVLRAAGDSSEALAEAPPALPVLDAICREDREHALHAARAALHSGRARMQRYPFAPRDGREALARLAEAVACARLAGDAAALGEASEQLARARQRIERDIRDHTQRYALLRKRERVREAADDIAYLTALGWPERGAFAEQLRIDQGVLEDEAREASR
jgi:hypothetical protein